MGDPRTVVISDIHVGAGVVDDCDAELEGELIAFIRALASHDGLVELVINGDFLDFVQAPPLTGSELEALAPDGTRLCFTEGQSAAKLSAIRDAHRPLFGALGDFLGSGSTRSLVILPGNHDADFFWPAVRTLFSDALGVPRAVHERLSFHLERVYRPRHAPHAWIEHGHQHDDLNSFFVGNQPAWSAARPPIARDRTGVDRLLECIGTRFMIRFMNHLDHDYPFVDNVKPFSRFLRIFGASALVPGFGPLKAAIAVWSLLRFLARTFVNAPGDILAIGEAGRGAPSAVLTGRLQELRDDQRDAFRAALVAAGFALNRPLEMVLADPETADALLGFLADHLELLEPIESDRGGLLGGGEPRMLALGGGFFADETASLIKAASMIRADPSVGTIIMGHTHEPVDREPPLNYVNTGSWTRYYQFAVEEQPRAWSLLRSRSYEQFPYRLHYAEVTPDGRARAVVFRERNKDA
jgi:hypothetical protein